MKGAGTTAFLVNGDTTNVLVKYDGVGGGVLIRSYGYYNRVVASSKGGGSRSLDTALPGNGAIVVIEHTGEWSINKVKEVVDDEKK